MDTEEETDFLDELNNDKYEITNEITEKDLQRKNKNDEREMKKMILEQEREQKRKLRENKNKDLENIKQEKRQNKINKKQGIHNDNDTDSLYGGESGGTPILGKDRLRLLHKVKQYKSLFTAELKTFKIKKNPTVEDLNNAIEEMSVLVEVNSMDGFMMDSVLSCMKLIEGGLSMTDYDIRGCADLLKQNKQFHTLCKTLFIKYGVFSSVPPEYQLMLLVSTTAYMCVNKNKRKGDINNYLNSTI